MSTGRPLIVICRNEPKHPDGVGRHRTATDALTKALTPRDLELRRWLRQATADSLPSLRAAPMPITG